MNLGLFNKMMVRGSCPCQNRHEWRMFLEICEIRLKEHKIENPVVVELGLFKNRQKKFYERLLDAEHIGVNINSKHTTPDIIGNTHDPETLEALKKKLGRRPINILFIDASHTYESVKKDFEIYSPLCSDIVAFHDIELSRHENDESDGVWKLWDELKMKIYKGEKGYRDFMDLSIHQQQDRNKKGRNHQMGIGMILKR